MLHGIEPLCKPKSLKLADSVVGSTSPPPQDTTEEYLRAIAFGLDRLEAMSPAERASLVESSREGFPIDE